MRIFSFEPVIDDNSRLLILGSMPGRASLQYEQYYAHPKNRFWPMMFRLFNDDNPIEDYAGKLRLLLDNRIALWDVCESCEREGSLDKAITAAKPNDVPGLLKRYPGIRHIAFNGSAAKELFNYNFKSDISTRLMPSTSPVPRRYFRNSDDIFRVWKSILEYLSTDE